MSPRLAWLAARREERLRRRLSNGNDVRVSIADGKGVLHTGSHFHDPREAVGRLIAEALDPSIAPFTLRDERFNQPPPLPPKPARTEMGPETARAMAAIDARISRKAALRAAVRRQEARRGQGVTSDFVEAEKPLPRKGAAVEHAIEFLRVWLQAGPRGKVEILQDARRDGISKKTLYAAKALIGVDATRNIWTLPIEALATLPPPEPAPNEEADAADDLDPDLDPYDDLGDDDADDDNEGELT